MTDDQRPRGSCLIDGCPRDPYPREDGRLPLVCGPDVSRLQHWLREIPVLCGELQARDAPDEVMVWADVRPVLVGWHPPLLLQMERLTVASALPAAAVGVAGRGGRVSGSAEPRLPITVDAVDLLGPARSLRRLDDEDQVGFLSIASTLDFWVQDLRDHRARGEGLPEPSVTLLAGWLLERIEEACDDWLPVDEFAEDLRRAHGALRGQLGLVDVPDYRHGIPCPKCSALALVRLNGSEFIECGSCPAVLTITEYEEYVKTMSVEAVAVRKRQAVERRGMVRLLREMHAVGWRHTAEIEVEGTDLVFTHHYWRRPAQRIGVSVQTGAGAYDYVRFKRVDEDDFGEDDVAVATSWIAAAGVAQVHRLATAAGVLSVPKERAA